MGGVAQSSEETPLVCHKHTVAIVMFLSFTKEVRVKPYEDIYNDLISEIEGYSLFKFDTTTAVGK